MKIIQGFDSSDTVFNCSECQGLCCNLNSMLEFSKEQIDILDLNATIPGMLHKKNNRYLLRTPKMCWFLDKYKCSLDDATKPLCCMLYPITLWAIDDLYVVGELIPCPSMPCKNGKHISSDKFMHLTNMYIKKFGIEKHPSSKLIVRRQEISIENAIVSRFKHQDIFLNPNINAKSETQLLLLKLFYQLSYYPCLLYLSIDELLDIYQDYINLCENYQKFTFTNFVNIQNVYLLIRNEITKISLAKYYYPSTDDINKINLNTEHFNYLSPSRTINNADFNKLCNNRSVRWLKK